MAQRRMFSLKVIDTDEFMDMPQTTQLLYYNLALRADDDGFVANPKRIIKMTGSNDDDMKVLIAKKYVIPFENGVCVIRHWRIHNYIQADRYTETEYIKEKENLALIKGKYEHKNKCIQDVSKLDTQDRLGKDRLGKSKVISYTPKDLELSKLLYELIKENNPAWYVKPNWDTWADDIRKLREIDNRTYEQIEFMIKWCQQDDFWKQNILSPTKLRKQFNNLVVKAKQSKNKGVTII